MFVFKLENKTYIKSFYKILSCTSVPVMHSKGFHPGNGDLVLCIWADTYSRTVTISLNDFVVW